VNQFVGQCSEVEWLNEPTNGKFITLVLCRRCLRVGTITIINSRVERSHTDKCLGGGGGGGEENILARWTSDEVFVASPQRRGN
jgi:hypothetical protein